MNVWCIPFVRKLYFIYFGLSFTAISISHWIWIAISFIYIVHCVVFVFAKIIANSPMCYGIRLEEISFCISIASFSFECSKRVAILFCGIERMQIV